MYNKEEWSPQQIDNINKQKHPCFDLKLFVAAKKNHQQSWSGNDGHFFKNIDNEMPL